MSISRQPVVLRRLLAVTAALLVCAVTGCGTEEAGPDLEQLREQFLSDRLPDEIASLAKATAEQAEEEQVTVVGRIFADKLSPFDPDAASFSLYELPKPGHDHENPGDCPFCKREMENAATAIIQVVDDAGEVLPYSAEQLFGFEKNQDLVVSGKPTMFGDDVLIIAASVLHVLSDEDAQDLAKQVHSGE